MRAIHTAKRCVTIQSTPWYELSFCKPLSHSMGNVVASEMLRARALAVMTISKSSIRMCVEPCIMLRLWCHRWAIVDTTGRSAAYRIGQYGNNNCRRDWTHRRFTPIRGVWRQPYPFMAELGRRREVVHFYNPNDGVAAPSAWPWTKCSNLTSGTTTLALF